MNTTEIRNAAINEAVNKLNLSELGVQIGTSEYVIPVEVNGEVRHVSAKLTLKNNKDTATTTAFDLDDAIAAWEETKAEAAAKAEAAKKPKKTSSRKKEKVE